MIFNTCQMRRGRERFQELFVNTKRSQNWLLRQGSWSHGPNKVLVGEQGVRWGTRMVMALAGVGQPQIDREVSSADL